jgi:FHS family L-fucose permease-like MFS transporter
MNDILIKQFMNSFEINRFGAGLIQSAFYMGYFLLATPAALVMRKHSYKTGKSSGCCIAWGVPSWPMPMVTLRSLQMS